jgi:hypothetical protein
MQKCKNAKCVFKLSDNQTYRGLQKVLQNARQCKGFGAKNTRLLCNVLNISFL